MGLDNCRQLRELGTDADGLGYFDGPHVMEGNGVIPELERIERAQERRLAAESTCMAAKL